MSSSSGLVASTVGRATPKSRARWGNSSITGLCNGLSRLTKNAIFEAPGTSSRRICICFAKKSLVPKKSKLFFKLVLVFCNLVMDRGKLSLSVRNLRS
jgi:hypothetical protein